VAAQGRRRQEIEDARLQRLREIFDHLREVYVYRAAGQAARLLRSATEDLTSVYRTFQMLSTGPRFILEVVLIGVLLAAVVAGLKEHAQSLIVSVGVFAASGFRLLVGANRVIMSAQAIRFGQPSLDRVLSALPQELTEGACAAAAAQAVSASADTLALRDVEFRYPGSDTILLSRAEIEVRRGVMIGIRGGSGGGKTTLLEVLAGLRPPTSGSVLVDGRPLTDPGTQLFRLVGYVAQSPAVFSDTVRRNVAYGYEDHEIDDSRVWVALRQAHLDEFVRSLPGGLDFVLASTALNLSGGQAQRISLARALYPECSFLLLDEPTSALDPATEAQIVSTLSELSEFCGVLVVSHRPKPLEACQAVYELRQGRLTAVEERSAGVAQEPGR
jgi:ABC-type multidrug transport system fused ATPase/permease subunit